MESAPPQPLRASEQTVQRYLDQLDEAAQAPRGIDLRRWERFGYRRRDVTVEFARGGDTGCQRYAVATRNISRVGLGFLAGQFVYAGTPCQVGLRTRYGSEEIVGGRTVRCRYLPGSGSLYEVGVHFERPVDVTLFAPRARVLRILLVDEEPVRHRLLSCLLQPLPAQLVWVTTPGKAAEAAATSDWDLILVDLDCPGFDAFAATKELRAAGYLGPIVGLAAEAGCSLHERCAAAGCTGYLRKPVTHENLRAVVEALMAEPIVSTLAHNATLAPLVDEFVASLRARMKELSRAFELGDLATVRRLAREVRAAAASYGFDVISEEAEHLQAVVALDVPPERLRSAVYDLIHLCLAARPATAEPATSPLGDQAGDGGGVQSFHPGPEQ